ncbi:MAG: DUF2798 domain-containing protein [Campylobacter sp.]
MAFFMSFIISAILTFINLGFVENFALIWLINWLKALVVAYPCVLIVAPFATMLTKAICKEN